jgi:6-phosphogluconolactonase (cycloisomerase 2 family)
MPKVVAALILVLAVLPASRASAQGPPGALTSLGCLATPPAPTGCVGDAGVNGVGAPAFSPDGRQVYVPARNPGSVTVYARDAATGVLTRTACFSATALGGCTTVPELAGAAQAAVAPDGRNLYVTTSEINGQAKPDGVVAFTRAADGTLAFLGCAGEANLSARCATVAQLNQNAPVAVSPDGSTVYVGSQGTEAVTAFARGAGGGLAQIGCVANNQPPPCTTAAKPFSTPSSIVVAPDGHQVYVSDYNTPYRVIALDRAANGSLTTRSELAACVAQPGTADCLTHTALHEGTSLAMSADGRFLYVTTRYTFDPGGQAVILIARDGLGSLSLPANDCWETATRHDAGCVQVPGLMGPDQIVLSPNGAHAYVTSIDAHGLVIFDRDATTGRLTQQPLPGGCLLDPSIDPTLAGCATLRGSTRALFEAVSPDGRELVATGNVNDYDTGRLWSLAVAPDPTPVPTPVPTVAPTPTPTPPPRVTLPPPAPPVAGVRADAGIVGGTVQVTLPNGVTAPLTSTASLPVGSIVDARAGALTLTTAAAGKHASARQSARIAAGIFRIRQRRGSAQTDLVLVSAAGAEARCAGAHPGKGVVRSLSVGVTKGVFRTVGGAATTAAEGRAAWSSADRCDGTLVRVTHGRVAVAAKGRRARTVRAGHALLVRARLFTVRQHGG